MKTKEVYVTVRLVVPADIHIQELTNELGYQFSYIDGNEMILDSEMIKAEEMNDAY